MTIHLFMLCVIALLAARVIRLRDERDEALAAAEYFDMEAARAKLDLAELRWEEACEE